MSGGNHGHVGSSGWSQNVVCLKMKEIHLVGWPHQGWLTSAGKCTESGGDVEKLTGKNASPVTTAAALGLVVDPSQ